MRIFSQGVLCGAVIIAATRISCYSFNPAEINDNYVLNSERIPALFTTQLVIKIEDIFKEKEAFTMCTEKTKDELYSSHRGKIYPTLIERNVFFNNLFLIHRKSADQTIQRLLRLIALLYMNMNTRSSLDYVLKQYEPACVLMIEDIKKGKAQEERPSLKAECDWFFDKYKPAAQRSSNIFKSYADTVKSSKQTDHQYERDTARLVHAVAILLLLSNKLSIFNQEQYNTLLSCITAFDISRLIVLSMAFQLPMALIYNLDILITEKKYSSFDIIKGAKTLCYKHQILRNHITSGKDRFVTESLIGIMADSTVPRRTVLYTLVIYHLFSQLPYSLPPNILGLLNQLPGGHNAYCNEWPPYLWENVCMDILKRLSMQILANMRTNTSFEVIPYDTSIFMTYYLPDGAYSFLLGCILHHTILHPETCAQYPVRFARINDILVKHIEELIIKWLTLEKFDARQAIEVLHTLLASYSYAKDLAPTIIERCGSLYAGQPYNAIDIYKAVLLGCLRAINCEKAVATGMPKDHVTPSYKECASFIAATLPEAFTLSDQSFTSLIVQADRMSVDVTQAFFAGTLFYWHKYASQQTDAVKAYKEKINDRAKCIHYLRVPTLKDADHTLDIFRNRNIGLILLRLGYNKAFLDMLDSVSEEYIVPDSTSFDALLANETPSQFLMELHSPQNINTLCYMLAKMWITELGLIFVDTYKSMPSELGYFNVDTWNTNTIKMSETNRFLFLSGLLASKNIRVHVSHQLLKSPKLLYSFRYIILSLTLSYFDLSSIVSLPAVPPLIRSVEHTDRVAGEVITTIGLLRLSRFITQQIHALPPLSNINTLDKFVDSIKQKIARKQYQIAKEVKDEINQQFAMWKSSITAD